MHFDSTIQAGSLISAVAFVISALLIYRGWVRWQAQIEACVQELQEHKVGREDCARIHATVVTQGFCTTQHDRTNTSLEKLTEEFGTIGLTVQKLLTNQEWVMDAVKTLHRGVTLANPHPEPLPPDPRDGGPP